MNKLKKRVTGLLCFSIMLSSFILPAFASYNVDECMKKNRKGQFLNEDCAKAHGINRVKNGEPFVKISNVGYNAGYTVHVFDYKNIDKVFSEFPYITPEKITEIYKNEKEIKTQRKEAIFKWLGFTGKLILKGGMCVIAFVTRDHTTKLLVDKMNRHFNQKGIHDFLNSEKNQKQFGLATTASTTLAFFEGTSIPNAIPKLSKTDYHKLYYSNQNALSIMAQILDSLKYQEWKGRDVLVILTENAKSSRSAIVNFNPAGKNYSDEEKEKFESNFNSIKEELQVKIQEYEKGEN